MPLPHPYEFPPRPHIRRHGPVGYTDYGTYKEWLRDEFQFRCAYCLHREMWERRLWRTFEIDHIVPQVLAPDRVLDYAQHFRFLSDGKVEASTLKGSYLIEILGLEADYLERNRRRVFRNYWDILDLIDEYGEDDEDALFELQELLGYPNDVPNLTAKKPPTNSRPEGRFECYFVKLQDPNFPKIY